MNEKQSVNILVTVDANYVPYLNIMLFSLLRSNADCRFDVYLLHSSLLETDVEETRKILGSENALHLICVDAQSLKAAPTTDRYPKEIYYRIFAAQYLPQDMERVLYLDPDIIVNRSILPLYHIDMESYFFAAATHIRSFLLMINSLRLNMDDESPYINSGVMLMNLKLLREEQDMQEVFDFIKKYSPVLFLPDQDIISSLYGTRILAFDTFRYNMTEILFMQHAVFERKLDIDWVREHTAIIHYCGRNKPWKSNYFGSLDVFYKETVEQMKLRKEEPN